MEYCIYSTPNLACKGGKKRCIYKAMLEGIDNNYTLDYLVSFFERKAAEYFRLYVSKPYPKSSRVSENLYQHNYFSALQVVWVVKTLKALSDCNYNFQITNIYEKFDGWQMCFDIDTVNLNKKQIELLYSTAFKDNQLKPFNIVLI